MDLSIITILGAFFLSIFIGLLIGIFGVGGGFLLTPSLMIILGVSGPVAVGTSLASILVNSTYGLYERRNSGTIDVKMSMFIGAGSIAGVFLGSIILEKLENLAPIKINGKEILAVQFILLCCFLFLLSYIAVFMIYDYNKTKTRDQIINIGFFTKCKIPPYGIFNSLEYPRMSLILLILLGTVTGFLTGLLGIGGGVIIIPALIYLVGLNGLKAAGTSLLLVWISSFVAVFKNISANNIDWYLCSVLVIGGIIGTFFGTKIGLKISGRKMKIYFVYVVLLAVIMTGYKVLTIIFL